MTHTLSLWEQLLCCFVKVFDVNFWLHSSHPNSRRRLGWHSAVCLANTFSAFYSVPQDLQMKLAELGLFYTSLLRCSDNPVHLNVLLKSTALLEALQTDLAVEVGVLPGPAAIHPSGTGRHLPRQVLLALNSFRQIVQANMMSLCIWLACTFSFILNVFFHNCHS